MSQELFSASRSNGWQRYKIKKGDNLTTISKKFNVTVGELIKWNNLKKKNRILVGQKLKIKQYVRKYNQSRKIPKKKLKSPVANLRIVRHFQPYGYAKNHGIVCKISGMKSIKSSATGSIVKVGYLRGYGDYILIDHGFGWHTMYSNLRERYVHIGQKVNAGDRIGTVMNHKLFFLISYRGTPVNPEKYLER